MLNLNQATTMEIQLERDNCQAMLDVHYNDYRDGLLSVTEWLNKSAPLRKRYRECIDRLIKDWAFASKIAQQLEL